MMWSLQVLVLLSLGCCQALAAPFSNGTRVEAVQTTSGLVNGHEAPWPKNAGVAEYLGIPFAEPPLGPLRFAAPQTYKPRGPIPGAQFSPGCLQAFDLSDTNDLPNETGPHPSEFNKTDDKLQAYGSGMGGNFKTRKYSEDCLALNIWSKPGSKGKAVMIWIYGGAFGSGDTAGLYYNGARLAAEQDVIVASINYRVSAFGFPGAPTLPDQNVGLLDQRKGVEWLRDNIEKFGGDPKRMTLFGESAGGMSVDSYSYAWVKDPIINAFIPQSGTASMKAAAPKAANESSWYRLTNRLGCGKEKDGAKTVECMRSLPAATISKQVIEWSAASTNVLGLLTGFGPRPDGKIVFDDYAKRQQEGNFIKRPILIGNMDKEGALFPGMAEAAIAGYGKSKGEPTNSIMNLLLTLIDAYLGTPEPPGATMSPLDRLACGTAPGAAARRAAGVPAWRYRWFGEWPNLEIYPQIGAYHSMDVPLVFGATERTSNVPDTPEEAAFVKNIMTAWATFAKDPEHGLEKLGWPIYDPKANTLIGIGYQNGGNVTMLDPSNYDKGCGN
ncbi:alpha/beta-hydrolase [Microthyrium microscopicum]|uniref:Carboxylic ester hydrolase n=1 Tax=Microthyrium microscopicum TaxID=703497 RepID=A0A6A6TX19_9PEZI|nr:alpha/beta-hydrolase [Microthyrium microscopicum]